MLTVILMAFDIGEPGMEREVSRHWKDLWTEMILEGFSNEDNKKDHDTETEGF